MSKIIKSINSFFRKAIKKDVDNLTSQIVFSERQEKIFKMFYLQKKDIGFIADSLCVCRAVVNNELKTIREKIARIIETEK